MAENRATKSGLAREAQEKIKAKYDQQGAEEVMRWIAQETGEAINTSGDPENVHKELKDGYVLQVLGNKIKGVSTANCKREKMPFKQMDVIGKFITGIKSAPLGLPEHETFATVDLFEMQNMAMVITCLMAVARKCLTVNCGVRGFGVKEAESNRRSFTQEQLNEGKSIIGLQMGSNKGATQAGQNFGKGRMIVD